VLLDDASLHCWGDDGLGAVGDGNKISPVPTPTLIAYRGLAYARG
jgi:hypothetical protein